MESYNRDPTDLVNTDFIDWQSRKYFGRATVQQLGLGITTSDGTTPLDADGTVTFSYSLEAQDGTSTLIFSRTAQHMATGLYEVSFGTADTATIGNFHGDWTYTIASVAQTYRIYTVVGESNPSYDVLPPAFKDIVDEVWFKFADCFDSPSGGPNLQTYYQSHWSRGRMADLMGTALRRLNVIGQPAQTYTLNGVGGPVFPIGQWGGLLELALYVQALQHLQRSYVEQPQFVGGSVSRLDRTDYWQRWGMLLQDAKADLKAAQDTYKISTMFAGSPAVLVSGGAYGRTFFNRAPGTMVARPNYFYRSY